MKFYISYFLNLISFNSFALIFSIIEYNGSDNKKGDSSPSYLASSSTGIIRANVNQDYIQQSSKVKTVKLKVGGRATIYEGTKIKIRCPVKKFDR